MACHYRNRLNREYNYRLESENQEIATAILDEMSVCITTYKSGSTMIRLIDTDNNKDSM